MNRKDFEISVLTANSRYLQTAALKWQALERFALLATLFYVEALLKFHSNVTTIGFLNWLHRNKRFDNLNSL